MSSVKSDHHGQAGTRIMQVSLVIADTALVKTRTRTVIRGLLLERVRVFTNEVTVSISVIRVLRVAALPDMIVVQGSRETRIRMGRTVSPQWNRSTVESRATTGK